MKSWMIALKVFNFVREIVSRTFLKYGVTNIRVDLTCYKGSSVVCEFHKDYEV